MSTVIYDRPQRVLVCGGRDFSDSDQIAEVLARWHADPGIAVLIEGGANGADRLARKWAEAHGVPVETYEADWNTHGKAAGPIRNERMIREGRPDVVIAFAGGAGTLNMKNQARKAGLIVWEPLAAHRKSV